LLDSEHRAELRKTVIASTFGTTVEWHDFIFYSVVTGLVFGKLFLSPIGPASRRLAAFAVYSVGFVARPIGAVIFGPPQGGADCNSLTNAKTHEQSHTTNLREYFNPWLKR
jgi:hypothetical protein